MACQEHQGRQKMLVCVTCKTGICDLCVDEKHEGHKHRSYLSVAETVKKDLKELANSPEFTQLGTDFTDLTEFRQIEAEKVAKTKQQLLDQRDKIKQLADDMTDIAITKLDQHNDKLLSDLDQAKQTVTKQIQTFQIFRNEVGRIQNSEDPKEVVEQVWNTKPPEIVQLNFPKVSRLAFRHGPGNKVKDKINHLIGDLVELEVYAPSRVPQAVLEKVYGSVSSVCTSDLFGEGPGKKHSVAPSVCTLDPFSDGPGEDDFSTDPHPDGATAVAAWLKSTPSSQSLKCDVELTQKHSFKHFERNVSQMQLTVEGNCWIKHFKENKVQLINTKGEIQKVVPFNTTVYGIFVSPVTHQLLVCCALEKCIKQVVEYDDHVPTTTTLIRTDPLAPRYICMTPNGDIVVSLTDKTSWNVKSNSTSVLVKYNNKGEELARAHKDGHGGDLFFVSMTVSISSTGTVAVINRTAKGSNHLVLLDNNLKLILRNIDIGVTIPADTPMPVLPNTIYITDLKFNQNNLILVTEWYSRTIQLLDTMCNPLKVMVTEQQSRPVSLALHANGDLWVGLLDGTIKVYDYKCEFTVDV